MDGTVIIGWPKHNNDRFPRDFDAEELPLLKLDGWTSECAIYTLIRKTDDGHMYRFWQGANKEKQIPDGFEEFYTQNPRDYFNLKRM